MSVTIRINNGQFHFTAATKTKDVYQQITDAIIEKLEAGVNPWKRPWSGKFDSGSTPRSLATGKPYRGTNRFVLSVLGTPYESPFWVTYRGAQKLGGHVRKGESGAPCIFWKWIKVDRKDKDGNVLTDANGDPKKKTIPFARKFTVFNVEQTTLEPEQLPAYARPKEVVQPRDEHEVIEAAEALWEGYEGRPPLRHGGSRAFYRPVADFIQLPEPEQFTSSEGYYATLFHESIHSTGHESRLDRDTLTDACAFGDTNYSKEELVAEIGAAFLCGDAGIENDILDQSASYLQGWIKKLSGDPKLVVYAAQTAQKAVDHVLGTTFDDEDEE